MGSIPGWEDPLEKEMVTHSSFLTWEVPWTEEAGKLQSMGSQRVGHNSDLHFPGGSVVKNPPANARDTGLIPGWEDPLEKEMANHSSILAWKIP